MRGMSSQFVGVEETYGQWRKLAVPVPNVCVRAKTQLTAAFGHPLPRPSPVQ